MTLYLDSLLSEYGSMTRDYVIWSLPFSAGSKLIRASMERRGIDLPNARMLWITHQVDKFFDRIGWNKHGR